MSIINCSQDCIYQNDGKCTLDHINVVLSTSTYNEECGFFQEKKREKKSSHISINTNIT